MVLQEANGEPFSGMVAVAGTVFERMYDARWPDTPKVNHYHTTAIPRPDWPSKYIPFCTIGKHIFYGERKPNG
jgi:spore germination cell wall hydrolase CwlJ-like protein